MLTKVADIMKTSKRSIEEVLEVEEILEVEVIQEDEEIKEVEEIMTTMITDQLTGQT